MTPNAEAVAWLERDLDYLCRRAEFTWYIDDEQTMKAWETIGGNQANLEVQPMFAFKRDDRFEYAHSINVCTICLDEIDAIDGVLAFVYTYKPACDLGLPLDDIPGPCP